MLDKSDEKEIVKCADTIYALLEEFLNRHGEVLSVKYRRSLTKAKDEALMIGIFIRNAQREKK